MLDWALAPWTAPVLRKGPVKSSKIFSADWPKTLWLLDDETQRLKAGPVTIEVDVEAARLLASRQGFRSGTARSPGVRVTFDSKHGQQRFETCGYDSWKANVRAVALSLTALRAVDRYGVSKGEQYVGFRPELEAGPTKVDEDLTNPRRAIRWMMDTLRDQGDYDGGMPDQVYKRLAAKLHPDRGGADADTWHKLQAIKEMLESVKVL